MASTPREEAPPHRWETDGILKNFSLVPVRMGRGSCLSTGSRVLGLSDASLSLGLLVLGTMGRLALAYSVPSPGEPEAGG